MRDILPQIFSAQAAASGLNDQIYETIQTLVNHMIDLDTFLGTKCFELNSVPDTALPIIADQERAALGLARQAVETVRGHLRSAQVN